MIQVINGFSVIKFSCFHNGGAKKTIPAAKITDHGQPLHCS